MGACSIPMAGLVRRENSHEFATIETHEGKTPGLSDPQAKALLKAPDAETLKGKRDRAVLAVLLYHGLRREEAARLQVEDLQERRSIEHLRVHGKCGKLRYLSLNPITSERIAAYPNALSKIQKASAALFIPLRGPETGGRVLLTGFTL